MLRCLRQRAPGRVAAMSMKGVVAVVVVDFAGDEHTAIA